MEIFLIGLVLISVLSILYAFGEFVSPSRNELNWYLIISFISLAILSSHGALFLTSGLQKFPLLLGCYIPFILLLGPFFSLFMMKRLKLPISFPLWMHLIPSVVSICLLFLFHSDGGEHANRIILLPIEKSIESKEFPFLGLLNLPYLFYIIHAGGRILQTIELERIKKETSLRLIIILLSLTFITSTLSLFGFLFREVRLLALSLFLLILFLFLIYLIQRGFSEFFTELEVIVRQGKYQNSRLKGQDLAQIQTDLNKLMSIEKMYCDEDISLAILASEVGLSIHQLSEYFNQVLKKSFVSYINEFRIRDAQNLLIGEPETTVLAIAYQVGFNSKSAFNAAFLKETGCSPSVYRKRSQ